MSRLKVFVSMPFTGKPWETITEERTALHRLADSYGFEIVEQFIGYQGKEDYENKDYNPSFILAKDKNFIKESDVVIADFSTPSVGTDCEVTIAKELFDKKVYGVVPVERRRHMWLRFYCDHVVDSVEDAFKKVAEDFRSGHAAVRVDRRQYDPIAVEYRLVEETPAQKGVYDPAVESAVKQYGAGKKVIVLHAASGYRARLAKHAGAGTVVAIEISYKQTQIGKAEEAREPLGIEYLVLDPYSRDFLSSVPTEHLGTADVVLGAFLLDHAMTKDELKIVTGHIKSLLRPGGVFFALSDHPEVRVPTDSGYGVVVNYEEGTLPEEGSPRRISIYQNRPGGALEVLHFHNFLWKEATITGMLSDAGFVDIDTTIPEPVQAGFPEGFWDAYRANPSTVAYFARNP